MYTGAAALAKSARSEQTHTLIRMHLSGGGARPGPPRPAPGAWRRLPPGPVRDAYAAVQDRLRERRPGLSRRALEGCVNNLYRFLVVATAPTGGPPDPRGLSGAREDMERARAAWAALEAGAGWNPRHRLRVRTQLSWALACVAEALPYAVNPALRWHRGPAAAGGAPAPPAVCFTAARSFERSFDLHGCLPLRVRRLSPFHAEYLLVHRVVDELANHLRSVSRAHLQRAALWVDALLHGRPEAGLGAFGGAAAPDPDARWEWLGRRSGEDWLRRLGEVARHRGRPVSFEHFKRHVRYVQLLHGRVFRGGGAPVPVPVCGGRVYCAEALEGLSSSGGGGGGGPASGAEDGPAADHAERGRLRELVSALRAELCRPVDAVEDAQRAYAFNPEEVRSVVEAAVTPAERLVVVLFLTTGLRIGGLSRLQVPAELRSPAPAARDVPTCLLTVEKNGRVRRVRITDACRVLVARWYRDGRPASGPRSASRYLFPGGAADAPVSTRRLWDVCRGVFRRARMAGPHVHPHTFRHTVVQMLYMKGMAFDAIAKWIGHASPAVTSGVYGRLTQDNLNGLLRGVPFVDEGGSGDARERWAAVARFVTRPYVFDDRETEGLAAAAVARAPRPTDDDDLRATVRHLVAAEVAARLPPPAS